MCIRAEDFIFISSKSDKQFKAETDLLLYSVLKSSSKLEISKDSIDLNFSKKSKLLI